MNVGLNPIETEASVKGASAAAPSDDHINDAMHTALSGDERENYYYDAVITMMTTRSKFKCLNAEEDDLIYAEHTQA